MKLLIVSALLVAFCFEQESKLEQYGKMLGDNDPETRERAHEELVKMGEVVLDYVRGLKNSKDPEVSSRAASIEQAIQENLTRRPLKKGRAVGGQAGDNGREE